MQVEVDVVSLRAAPDFIGKPSFMRRETSNRLRYVIEELMPPRVRDSAMFRLLAEAAWTKQVSAFSRFRASAPFLTPAAYEALYRSYENVHASGDNTTACLHRIVADVVGSELCDIGCGGGHLLEFVKSRKPGLVLTGTDIVLRGTLNRHPQICYREAQIESLPFPDSSFDTVVCTHVLEHILDIHRAIAELRRITRKRLIMVVPREREGIYTFNPHFHFFSYKETFLRTLVRVPEQHHCSYISRDIYYWEDKLS